MVVSTEPLKAGPLVLPKVVKMVERTVYLLVVLKVVKMIAQTALTMVDPMAVTMVDKTADM